MTQIKVNGRTIKLVSRWVIPRTIEEDYCNYDVTLIDGTETIHISHTGLCALCERRFEEATKDTALPCRNIKVNREIGHVAVVCIDCTYYLMYIDGYNAVPKSILSLFKSGFKPKNVDKFL